MTNNQPQPARCSVHPEMLAGIPENWRDALVEFITTGRTAVKGFDEFLDSSQAAQDVVDTAFEGHLRGAGQKHIDRIARTGGRFQAAESLAEQSGLSLDRAMNLEEILKIPAERIQAEETDRLGE